MAPDIVIVGAGPAGIRAAHTLVEAGIRPVVVDEAPRCGGQIYRRPPPSLMRDPRKLYGFEAKHARRLHRVFDSLSDRIDHWPESLVWSAHERRLGILAGSGQRELTWDRLILATGAMDRVIPFAGWTLPGVYTLGGAQTALKYQACSIGASPLFLGTGPLLYLVAYQYAAAGVSIRAVLDTAPMTAKLQAVPGLMRGGRTFLEGLYYLAWLRTHGVAINSGVRPLQACAGPDGALAVLEWQDTEGKRRRTSGDALAVGFGLTSETQLADLCGAPFGFSAEQRQWLPLQDADGRAGIEGLYLAGDSAGVRGARAAELGGERAALALLHDLGYPGCAKRLAILNRRLARFDRFRTALETAFPFPADLARTAADDLMICRCEGIAAGAMREAAQAFGATEINRAKAVTRVGMGRCQGRICGPAATEILAGALKVPVEEVGRLRGQAPIKPMPMTAFLDGVAP